MKTNMRMCLVGSLLLTSSMAFAGNHIITPKLGTYNLDSTSQTIVNVPSTFTDDSNSYLGVEYQYKLDENMTIGGSLDSFDHNYTRGGINGTVDTTLAMFNFKYNFHPVDWASPYVGVMAGIASVDMTGSVQGSASDFATGYGFGVNFPINDTFGAGLEYRKFDADVAGGGTTNIDVSGDVLSANLQIKF